MLAGRHLSLLGGGVRDSLSLSLETRIQPFKERHSLGQLQSYNYFFFCKPLFPVLFSIYTLHLVLRKHWWFGVLVVSGSIFNYKETFFSR